MYCSEGSTTLLKGAQSEHGFSRVNFGPRPERTTGPHRRLHLSPCPFRCAMRRARCIRNLSLAAETGSNSALANTFVPTGHDGTRSDIHKNVTGNCEVPHLCSDDAITAIPQMHRNHNRDSRASMHTPFYRSPSTSIPSARLSTPANPESTNQTRVHLPQPPANRCSP